MFEAAGLTDKLHAILAQTSVLVVERDAAARTMYCELVRSCGVKDVQIAGSHEEANELLARYEIDVVVIDITDESDSDIAFLRALRAHNMLRIRSLGVTALSADKRSGHVRRIIDAGVDYYVVKPASRSDFAKRIALASRCAEERRADVWEI